MLKQVKTAESLAHSDGAENLPLACRLAVRRLESPAFPEALEEERNAGLPEIERTGRIGIDSTFFVLTTNGIGRTPIRRWCP